MKRKLVVGFVAAMLAGLLVTPAHANPSKGPLASAALVECQIALDHFPQPVKTTNSSNCNGVSAGVFAGLRSSAPGGPVAGIAAASPTSITAQYTEPCVEGALGFSNGVGTVSGLIVEGVNKGLTLDGGTGTASIPYSWTRAGAVAVITTGKLNPVVDAKKGSQSTLTWTGGGTASDAVGGLGLGVLIPTDVPSTLCPGTPLVVQIVSVLVGL
jgi:hypothetical protein